MANWSPATDHSLRPDRKRQFTNALPAETSDNQEPEDTVPRYEHGSRVLKARAIAAVLVAAVAGLTYVAMKSPDHEGKSGEPETYTVQRGDTEWSLAEMIAPDVDPRKKMEEIDGMLPKDFAHAGRTLQPGDTITYRDGKIISYSASSTSGS